MAVAITLFLKEEEEEEAVLMPLEQLQLTKAEVLAVEEQQIQ